MRIPWPVAAIVLLLGLVGNDLVEDAFSVARNYSWSSAALIPLLEVVALNLALIASAALVGWMLRLSHRRRWHGALEMTVLYVFSVAGWMLLERFVGLFITF